MKSTNITKLLIFHGTSVHQIQFDMSLEMEKFANDFYYILSLLYKKK